MQVRVTIQQTVEYNIKPTSPGTEMNLAAGRSAAITNSYKRIMLGSC